MREREDVRGLDTWKTVRRKERRKEINHNQQLTTAPAAAQNDWSLQILVPNFFVLLQIPIDYQPPFQDMFQKFDQFDSDEGKTLDGNLQT